MVFIEIHICNMSHKFKKKFYLYQKQEGKCAVTDCQVKRIESLTIDHIVQQSVAKNLGWTRWQIHSLSNLQLLCKFHHILKDFPNVNKERLYKRFGFDYIEAMP